MNPTYEVLADLIDRLNWLEDQEWMVQEWLMATLQDDFPHDPRYIASKARSDGLKVAAREAHLVYMQTSYRDANHRE